MHIQELFSLKEKVIVVTGGSGLYGKCLVEGLAEAGGRVITTSRNLESAERTAAEFQKKGLDVQPMQVDQAEPDSVLTFTQALEMHYGRLDVFVNNAVARPMNGYNGSLEQFAESMRVNATGMWDLLRAMIEQIIASGGGSVINISSMMGMKGPDLSNYEGTDMGDLPPDYFFHNAGLINLTRFLAKMHTGKHIRFNCISPGGLFNHQPAAFVRNYCKKVPLGRMAANDDIKGLAVLLASDAGAYINGENILMDGGLNA
ncbi:NAD(P)-dependent dehydrogenase, short-chain alcohol dehydrogenase family [Cyclobacterium xiamenense]|uniref:NAD(P)-dependent dehydrogenase, short-chain alcohol dehydrogenase family n=1 Tax=Cyclobacterium xiamenense TaxID=1297121 RepID=A0A1H7BKE0_9BACT|nr:SDR family oxidoreductase [Cyclobacterium xiamenense]SEJ73855.1 NAD(P)-dependent dehydrogenase, short-chain alcohol dehydrogenase family [Cyclobacterium xiamenense]